MNNSKYKLSIIFGCPRSGTTFLLGLLNCLKKSSCINGIIFPASLPQIFQMNNTPEIIEYIQQEFILSIDRYLNSGMFNSKVNAIQKWYNSGKSIKNLFNLKDFNKIEHVIYKEPFFSFTPKLIYDAMPTSKIIYIYRDGRDCADSLVRTYDILTDEKLKNLNAIEMRAGRKYDERYVPWWVESGRDEEFIKSSSYIRAIWMWKEMVKRCESLFSQPDIKAGNRVLKIKYENFMRHPEKYKDKILDHLGLNSNKAFENMIENVHTKSIGIFKKNRKTEDIDQANKIAKEELKFYDYI